MGCHINVKTDSPEVQKIHKYWNEKKPIPWNRVHRIRQRNYVYFTHERHIKAEDAKVNNPNFEAGKAGIACEACHGEVKAMEKMRAFSSLKMGWCVSCHRANDAPTDCLICHK
jgi:copper homeostasis protein CutC